MGGPICPCKRPTTRRVLDVFEPIARHTILAEGSADIDMFSTQLSPIHRAILKLSHLPATEYHV